MYYRSLTPKSPFPVVDKRPLEAVLVKKLKTCVSQRDVYKKTFIWEMFKQEYDGRFKRKILFHWR